MLHYHLISICSFNETTQVSALNPLYGCLYQLEKPKSGLFEEIYIFSVGNIHDTLKTDKFIIADFFYMQKEEVRRCYVLCPITESNEEWVHYFDHVYKMPLKMDPIIMVPGNTSCSPKGYAYHDGKVLYQFNIKDENYAAMLCFPYQQNSLIRTYFAFCKVKEEHIHMIDREWSHEDDPVFFETKDSNLNVRRKKFLHHLKVKPGNPSHSNDDH